MVKAPHLTQPWAIFFGLQNPYASRHEIVGALPNRPVSLLKIIAKIYQNASVEDLDKIITEEISDAHIQLDTMVESISIRRDNEVK